MVMEQEIEDIKRESLRVKEETREGGNTAERIGGLFEKIADVLVEQNTGTIEEFRSSFDRKAGEIFKS